MFLSKLETRNRCRDLLDDFAGALNFRWDKGFDSLLAEFSSEKQEAVMSVLERHLGFHYDCHSIRRAPEPIRKKSGDLGDLRDNQLLFSSDPEGKELIFAAWWPWRDGKLVSMRLASPMDGELPSVSGGILGKLKGFLG